MKKISILLMSVFCFSIIMAGCNFKNLAVPEEVKVKMDATYEFPIASFDSEKNEKLDISKYFDLEQLIGGSNEEEEQSESATPNFNIYKYYDGHSQYQQYLLHMPIKEIDFDFSSVFENFDVSTAIQGFNINQPFSIPDVGGINENKEVDLTSIETAVNTAVVFAGMTSAKDCTVTFVSGPEFSFDSVEYISGKFVIDTNNELNVFGCDVDGTMTLLDENGNTVASAPFINNKAEINIAGKKLYSGMKLHYSGYSFSSLGKYFSARISSDSKIKVAKGVTLDSSLFEIPTVNVTFPVALGSNLQSVTINEGSLTVNLEEPDTWDGEVIRNYEIDITGSIQCQVDKDHNSINFSEDPKQLTSGNINAAATVTIVLDDATIDFENKPKVYVTTNIQKISAVVQLPEGFETSIDKTTEVPSDLTNFVDYIDWNELGFRIKAVNNLPAGNNIQLAISSEFLGIDSTTPVVIQSGLGDQQQTFEFISRDDPDTEECELHTEFEAATETTPGTQIDVHGQIILPGGGTNIAVSNVVPGQSYNISLVIEPVFDWAVAGVKMPENLSNFTGEFNTNINKKAMFDSLGEDVASKLNSIQVDSIPLYLFANVPQLEVFDNVGFAGKIRAFYGKDVEGTDEEGQPTTVIQPVVDPQTATAEELAASEVWILGERDEDPETLDFSPMPALVKNEADEVTTQFGTSKIDFADALNLTTDDNEATLCIQYDVGLSGAHDVLPVSSADVEELKQNGKCSIAMDLALVLTLDFTITDKISLNLMDMMNSSDEEGENSEGESSEGSENSENTENTENTEGEESQSNNDILGREGPTDMGQFEDYIDLIEYAGITIENFKLPISGQLGLNIKVPAQDANSEDFEKKISIGGKETNLSITKDDLRTFLDTYPLNPEINLVIGKENESSTFGLLRNAPVSGNIKVKVKAKGEIPVYPFAEKNNEEGGSN